MNIHQDRMLIVRMPQILQNEFPMHFDLHQAAIQKLVHCGYASTYNFLYPDLLPCVKHILKHLALDFSNWKIANDADEGYC